MIIEKVMNNNCVQASMNGQEVIISGPGVGYNKKYGMSVPEHPANRIFYVRNEQKNKLYKLIEHVTYCGGLSSQYFLFCRSTLYARFIPVCSLDLRYSLYGSEESAVSGEHDLTE